MQHKQEADQEIRITVHYLDDEYDCHQIMKLSDQNNYNRHKNDAEQGDVDAQYQLAECYCQGTGVEQDYAEALNWYKKAANQGHVYAQSRLADCYYWGHGVEINYIQAVNWYKKVADQGHVYAQSRLADCYFQGHGVKQDQAKAVNLYEKAVELSLVHAKNRGVYDSHYLESKLDRDCNVRKLEKEAEQDIAYIRNKLADCYFYGFGVEADSAKAINQLEKAAKLGEDILARRRLAISYFFGKHVKENPRKTEEYLLSVSALTYEKQQVRVEAELGIFYYHKEDYYQAFNYITQSSELNDGFGCLWLSYFFKNKPDIAIKLVENSNRQNSCFQNISLLKSSIFSEYIVAKPLYMASASLFLEHDNNYYDQDTVSYAFPKEVIHFLEDESSSSAKVILAFYYRCRNEGERYIECLKQASSKQDIIANYLLGKYYKDRDIFDKATYYFNKVDKERKVEYSLLAERPITPNEYLPGIQQYLARLVKDELRNIEIKEKNINYSKPDYCFKFTENQVYAGAPGKERALNISLSSKQLSVLLGMAAYRRGFKFEPNKENIGFDSNGWINVKNSPELQTKLKQLTAELLKHKCPLLMIENCDDEMFRLLINSDVIYFDEALFTFSMHKTDLNGTKTKIPVTIERKTFVTALGVIKAETEEFKVTLDLAHKLKRLSENQFSSDNEEAVKTEGRYKHGLHRETKFLALGLRRLIRREEGVMKFCCKLDVL